MVELIEPQKNLLTQPSDEQLLYKIMSVKNLKTSISNSYLHFNRVDSYKNFPNADQQDGEQLPKDRPGNTASKFIKAPNFSLKDVPFSTSLVGDFPGERAAELIFSLNMFAAGIILYAKP